jgi:hypothetical protein
MATKKKTFDAVAESRRWRRKTSRRVRGMTLGERLAFFNRRPTNHPGASAAKPARELARYVPPIGRNKRVRGERSELRRRRRKATGIAARAPRLQLPGENERRQRVR